MLSKNGRLNPSEALCKRHHWLVRPDPERYGWDRWTCTRCPKTRTLHRNETSVRPSLESTWSVEELVVSGHLVLDFDESTLYELPDES
jgi:hypothetical protein